MHNLCYFFIIIPFTIYPRPERILFYNIHMYFPISPVSRFLFSVPVIPASSPLSESLPNPSRCCCHGDFPGDGVVMDTGRWGGSADVWCRSDMCTGRCDVQASPQRLISGPSGSGSFPSLMSKRMDFVFPFGLEKQPCSVKILTNI